MNEVAGFPLAFERQGGSAREVVLLGMVPIGAIERLPTGRRAGRTGNLAESDDRSRPRQCPAEEEGPITRSREVQDAEHGQLTLDFWLVRLL